jgi:outer membrane protein TolC
MYKIITIIAIVLTSVSLTAQESTTQLTLGEVIQLAKDQSPDAILAKHRYRNSYWRYRKYRSSLLPQLSVSGNLVNADRSTRSLLNPDGSTSYVTQNNNISSVSFDLNQAVPLTGGTFFVESSLGRLDDFSADSNNVFYQASPISIGYSQPLNFYNEFKWNKKIEPMRLEEAKRNYIEQLELISAKAVTLFFGLAMSQLNIEITEANYHNNDTIFKIAQGRYNIGTIAENELLQIELSYLNAQAALSQAKIDLQVGKNKLRSFLGYNGLVDIRLVLPDEVPTLQLNLENAMGLAKSQNSEMLRMERELIESKRNVAQAKAENNFSANLYGKFGLDGQGLKVNNAYTDNDNSLGVQVGISIPILDWGVRRGNLKMAQSQQEVVRTQIQQQQIDFEQDVMVQVMQFNQQGQQVFIAAKADTIAQKRYNVTKQRFLIGKVDVLDLNVASTEKDVARRGFISAQSEYWNMYYGIRQLTLYDFAQESKLEVPFDMLVED